MSTSEIESKEASIGNGRNSLFTIIGFVALLALIAAGIFGSGILDQPEAAAVEQGTATSAPSTAAQLPSSGGALTVGDLPYEFTLNDLDGNLVTLSQFVGQPIIINFWATWCAPCRVEMPELQAAFDAYQEEDLVILALNHDESPEAVQLFFEDEFGLTFTPLLDEDKKPPTIMVSAVLCPLPFSSIRLAKSRPFTAAP